MSSKEGVFWDTAPLPSSSEAGTSRYVLLELRELEEGTDKQLGQDVAVVKGYGCSVCCFDTV